MAVATGLQKAVRGSVPKNSRFRRDVQGLRAIAVIAVILDHMFHWPSGGFVGVDVFFVISGYMITGQLIREHERNGRISFAGFYRRRVKRLIPASVLTLVITAVASFVIFSQSRFQQTLWDAISGLLFSANWRFAATGTDYFQSASPPSPLQHFWSLAVEEQFYFIWPALMVAVFFLAGRRAQWDVRVAHRAIAVAMAILIAVSLTWSFWETKTNPTWAYFSTFSRAWELGVGAIIAVTSAAWARIPEGLRPWLAWFGIGGIAASLFAINAESQFPAPWAILPVAASALVIIANEGGGQGKIGVLTNPSSVYIGNISYSLYLWHFPIIIIASAVTDLKNPVSATITLLAVGVWSVYMFHLWEDRIRKSNWLEPKRGRSKAEMLQTGYKVTALSLLAIVTALVCAVVLLPSMQPATPVLPKPAASALPGKAAASYGPETDKLQKQITQSLAATEWPALTPSMDSTISGNQVPDDVSKCGAISPVGPRCEWGAPNAPKTAVIVGDSVALTYVEAVREALKYSPDWKIKTYAAFGCTFTDTMIANTDANIVNGCPAKKDEAVAAINSLQPDIVFITNTYEPRSALATKNTLSPQEWSDSTKAIVNKFKSSAKHIVFLAPPPSDVDVKNCFTKVSKPSDCVSQVTGQWSSIADSEQSLAKAVGGTWIDSRPWFCNADGLCPSFVGSTPTKVDKVHMSPDYAKKIGPEIVEAISKLL